MTGCRELFFSGLQHRFLVIFRSFGTNYRSHPQGLSRPRSLKSHSVHP